MKSVCSWISLILLATACSDSSTSRNTPRQGAPAAMTVEPATKKSAPKKLVVYCGRSEKLVGPALNAFRKESNIEIQIKYAGSAQLAATLLEEGANSPADVFLAQDASTLGFLEQKGVFQALPEDLRSQVPSSYQSKTGGMDWA